MKRNISILLVSLVLFTLVFGIASADEAVNLALGAAVRYSTSVENFGWVAEYVTNGMRDFDEENVIRGWSSAIRYFNPEIARENSTQWIKIDLENVYTITRVDLYPRSDEGNVGAYFPIDYVIQVSTEESAWELTDESDDGWTTVVTQIDVERPEDGAVQSFTFAPIAARYVRVKATKLQEGNDGFVAQLAEIEVYE